MEGEGDSFLLGSPIWELTGDESGRAVSVAMLSERRFMSREREAWLLFVDEGVELAGLECSDTEEL